MRIVLWVLMGCSPIGLIDVAAVGHRIEGDKRHIRLCCLTFQEGVEHLLPRSSVNCRRLCQHTVRIEQARPYRCGQTQHGDGNHRGNRCVRLSARDGVSKEGQFIVVR